ncbi:hypothetical protein Tco_0296826 [Tanacetum coccineum]
MHLESMRDSEQLKSNGYYLLVQSRVESPGKELSETIAVTLDNIFTCNMLQLIRETVNTGETKGSKEKRKSQRLKKIFNAEVQATKKSKRASSYSQEEEAAQEATLQLNMITFKQDKCDKILAAKTSTRRKGAISLRIEQIKEEEGSKEKKVRPQGREFKSKKKKHVSCPLQKEDDDLRYAYQKLLIGQKDLKKLFMTRSWKNNKDEALKIDRMRWGDLMISLIKVILLDFGIHSKIGILSAGNYTVPQGYILS